MCAILRWTGDRRSASGRWDDRGPPLTLAYGLLTSALTIPLASEEIDTG